MTGSRWHLVLLFALATAGPAASLAMAQPPQDSGFQVYFEFCARCHDNAAQVSAPKVAEMRRMGEPRVRRALTAEGGAMMPYASIVPPSRMELLIAYLSPGADRALDCGPPGRDMKISAPQCPSGVPAAGEP